MMNKVISGMRLFQDGDSICCVHDKTFINLQESPAGFGATEEEAMRDFILSCLDFLLKKGVSYVPDRF